MEFIVFLLVIAVCYCLYDNYQIKKVQTKPDRDKEEEKQHLLTYKKLIELKHKQCEISFTDKMITQTFKLTVSGVLEEVDKEWVLLSGGKSKKEQGNLIRITMIRDIKEIV